MKIVINTCYGGFSISKELSEKLEIESAYLTNASFDIDSDNYYQYRANEQLISAIEYLGIDNCNGIYAKLKIIDIPDDVEWNIEEYDGTEWISEVHQTWS